MADQKQIRARVAAALRAARRARNLTQEELAALAACSVETLSNAERGASLPGLKLFFDLARVLELDVSALIGAPKGRHAAKGRLALEAEAYQLAQTLSDEKLRLWLETGKVFGRE